MIASVPVIRGGGWADLPRSEPDWVNATFAEPEMTVADIAESVRKATGDLPFALRRTPGIFGYPERHVLLASAGGSAALGSVCVGGEAQAHRWMLQITGRGCEHVKDWPLIQGLLCALEAKITRLDIRLDFHDGEVTIPDVLSRLDRGEFTVRGRKPTSTVAGDWLAGKQGRTLYVGKPEHGKVLRVYEKGKQLGDLTSPWVRVEVQFGNRGRVIPLDALTDPDPYFAGAYPALAMLLPVATRTITSRKRASVADLGLKLFHLRLSYGAVLTRALAAGADEKALVDALRAPAPGDPGAPRWDEVKADLARHLMSRQAPQPGATA